MEIDFENYDHKVHNKIFVEVESSEYSNFYKMIQYYYSLEGNGAGGNLHIVLDDGNIEDSSIDFCHGYASANGDEIGVGIANILKLIPEDVRHVIYKQGWSI